MRASPALALLVAVAAWVPSVPSLAANVTRLEISGPRYVDENSTTYYTCYAYYDDGWWRDVTYDVDWYEDSWYATFDGDGRLRTYPVTSNQWCRLTVSLGWVSDTLDIVIQNNVSVLTGIEVSGPWRVDEQSTGNFTCTARYDDGSTRDVTYSAYWSEDSPYATIDSYGRLTTGSVPSDKSCYVIADYGGYRDYYLITISNVFGTLERLVVDGPTRVNESSSASYTCTAHYDDGSTLDVSYSSYWSEDSPYATISSTGRLTTTAVTSDQSCTLTATCGGRSASLHATIVDVAAPPPAVRVTITSCPTSVQRGRTITVKWTITGGRPSGHNHVHWWTSSSPWEQTTGHDLTAPYAVSFRAPSYRCTVTLAVHALVGGQYVTSARRTISVR